MSPASLDAGGTGSAAQKQGMCGLIEGSANLFGSNRTPIPNFDDGRHVRVCAVRTLLLAKPVAFRTFALRNACSARPHWPPHMGFAKICNLVVVYLNAVAVNYDRDVHTILQILEFSVIPTAKTKRRPKQAGDERPCWNRQRLRLAVDPWPL